MAIFDDEFGPSSKEKRQSKSKPVERERSTEATLSPPASGATPRSTVSKYADYAVPLAGAAALLHPGSRALMGRAAERIAPEPTAWMENKAHAVQKRFAPTSVSDQGIDLAPVTQEQMTASRGHILPGGQASFDRGLHTPQTLRAGTFAKEAEAILRETSSEGARRQDIYQDIVAKKHKLAASMTEAERLQFEDAMDNSSIDPPEHLKELVKDYRGIMKSIRGDIEDFVNTKAKTKSNQEAYKNKFFQGFVEDYFPRMHEQKMRPGATTADHLAPRTLPTLADVRAAGLTSKYKDVGELVNYYVASTTRHLAKMKAYAIMEDQGLIRYYGGKAKVPDGWAKVEGSIAERGISGERGYAPAPIATIFNNRYSKGFNVEVFRPIQHGLNAIKQGAFAGALYHGVTTSIQATASDVQSAVKLAQSGKVGEAAGKAAASPLASLTMFRKGRMLEKAWLATSPAARDIAKQFDFRTNPKINEFKGERSDLIAHVAEKAGARARSYAQAAEYHFSHEGSYYEAWRRGTLHAQGLADLKNLNPFKKNPFSSEGGFGIVLKHIGRTLDTLSEPMFKYYVPTIKNGALYGRLNDFLDLHPGATYKEVVMAARDIVDSIDNRFGEMIHDNIFWNQQLKQAFQLATVSYSYELGTLREIGGGITDLTKPGRRLSSERAAYLLALPIAYSYLATIYHTLKTGSPPDSVLDLVAPQTGGTDPRTGKPERLYPLGDMKDVVHIFEDPYALVAGKLGPGASALEQIITNTDWKGDPIHPPEASAMDTIKAYFQHVGNALTPIPFTTKYGPKTGFSTLEQAIGMRPAGMNLTDPQKAAQLKHIREQKAWRKKERYDQRDKALFGGEKFYGERHQSGGVD